MHYIYSICVCVYICTYIHTHMLCVYMYIHIYVHIYIHICYAYIYTHTCYIEIIYVTCLHMYNLLNISQFLCAHTHICVHTKKVYPKYCAIVPINTPAGNFCHNQRLLNTISKCFQSDK